MLSRLGASAETERPLARNFARLARKLSRSTKLELEIAHKKSCSKKARTRYRSKKILLELACSKFAMLDLLGFARYSKQYK